MRFSVRFFITCVLCAMTFSVPYPRYATAANQIMLGPVKKPLTNQDVVQMVRTKFADSTIVKVIQANNSNFDLSVTALVALKTAGASQQVIEEMLSAGTGRKEPKTTAVTIPPSSPPPPATPVQTIDPSARPLVAASPFRAGTPAAVAANPDSVVAPSDGKTSKAVAVGGPATAQKAPDAGVEKKGPAMQPGSQVLGPCVILKRMGPADQITSHMYSFGIRGKQFQYVEGDMPSGTNFHGRLTDHDVRSIQAHGGRLVIMEPKYSADDLREAKQSCKNQ